ncbi:hypothetical protein ASF69_04650 [Rhizobium sp. Leaf311]|uniref:hypothetical protein n=1 Tax=Rhizobium sp. Leaf311 TaxID=1736332 RepID=UPI0007133CBF|nr:hypothetical protein [Rhizobium sp. Leaf311]KQQ46520.1 hypothetical protein ASF69_04650 [Rhizobium sp. Leaf311]
MARKPTAKQQIRKLLDDLEPTVQKAFFDSIDNLRSNIELNRIVEQLERQDLDGALRLLNIDASAYRPLQKATEDVFESGGTQASKKVPKPSDMATATFRFDVRHPTAEQDLRQYSSTLVTRISEDQRQAVRDALADGIAQGRAPRRTALDIVGRLDRITGRREGGILGLSNPQAKYVENMRQRLLSGDKEELKKVLTMERRDKRFDRSILEAIKTGKKLDQATVDRMTGRYADRLLLLRGETIARTETMTAFNKGQMSSMGQAIAEGRLSAAVVMKVWHAFLDERTRFTHRLLNKTRVAFNDKFQTARGRFMAHPGDPEGGVEECACCRCWMEFVIDFLADLD